MNKVEALSQDFFVMSFNGLSANVTISSLVYSLLILLSNYDCQITKN